MDRHPRKAERRYSLEAEAELLRAQAQDPALRLRIEAAGCLGHAPALLALDGPPADSDEWLAAWWIGRAGPIARWAVTLDRVGPEAQQRVGIAITNAHMPYGYMSLRRLARRLLEDEERLVAVGKAWASTCGVRRDAMNFEHSGVARIRAILRPRSNIDPVLVRSCQYRHDHSWLPADELQAAIRDDLVPWLLGQGDPVAERVAERPDPARPNIVRYMT